MARLFVLLAIAAYTAGCVYRVADIPTVQAITPVREPLFIFVQPSNGRTYQWSAAANLAEDLELAGFSSTIVSDLSIVPNGAAVIDEISHAGCFSEPLLTVLTVGVIPHVGCREFGHSFSLHRKGENTKAVINAGFKVKVMVGWLTWPAALSKTYVYDGSATLRGTEEVAIRLLRRQVSEALASRSQPATPSIAQ
jgi:hypothetical protein